MSILLAASSTQPSQIPAPLQAVFLAIFIALSLASLVLAAVIFLGEKKRDGRSFSPVSRFGPTDSLLKHFVLIVCSILAVMIFAPSAMLLVRQLPEEQRGLAAGMIGTGLALVTMLFVNAWFRDDGTRLIGLSPGLLPHGILPGLFGLVIVLPWLFWLLQLADHLMRKYNVHVETEHDIFRVWKQGDTGRAFEIIAIFSAVILAPLYEELVFRGFLQTALTRLFTPGSIHRERLQAAFRDESGIGETGNRGNGDWPVSPIPPFPRSPILPPPPTARILAILLTSALFALIHRPAFIQPPIFLLSLGLGYVYERTSNLYASIFMHMFFNAAQFTMFLVTLGH